MDVGDLDIKVLGGIGLVVVPIGTAVIVGLVKVWKALNLTKDDRPVRSAEGPTTGSDVVIHWARLIEGLERFQRTLTDQVDALHGAHEECLRDAASLRRQNDQQELRIERLERQLTGPR